MKKLSARLITLIGKKKYFQQRLPLDDDHQATFLSSPLPHALLRAKRIQTHAVVNEDINKKIIRFVVFYFPPAVVRAHQ